MPILHYRVATETPDGWRWHCAWCHAEALAYASSWDAAVDALMDLHTPDCVPYQRWIQGIERHRQQWVRPISRRKRGQKDETHSQLTML